MQHDKKTYLSFVKVFRLYRLNMDEIHDCVQDFELYKLLGYSKHQMHRHFIIDYYIRKKGMIHSAQRKRGMKPTKVLRFGEHVERLKDDKKKSEAMLDLELLLRRIKLSPKKQKILKLHLMGYQNTEIGRMLGLTQGRVSQSLKEIVERLKRIVKK